MKLDDMVVNRERIRILSSEYDGGTLVPCSSVVGQFAFVNTDKDKSMVKEEVKFFLTTGFLFDVDIGKFVPLHVLPEFEESADGYLFNTSDGIEYEVTYPSSFPNKGVAHLESVKDETHVMDYRSVVADKTFVDTLIISRPYIQVGYLRMKLLGIYHRAIGMDNLIKSVFVRDYFDEEDKYFFDRLTGEVETNATFESLVIVQRGRRITSLPLKIIK